MLRPFGLPLMRLIVVGKEGGSFSGLPIQDIVRSLETPACGASIELMTDWRGGKLLRGWVTRGVYDGSCLDRTASRI